MKNIYVSTLVFMATIISTTLSGQHKEVAIRALNLGDLGNTQFLYKKQKSENTYRRYRLWSGNAGFSFLGDEDNRSQFSLGFFTGLENRKQINDRFQLIHGLEVGLGGNYGNFGQSRRSTNINASMGYVIGLQYSISDAFAVGIETIPSLSYSYNRQTDGRFTNSSHNLNLTANSSSVAFTGVYRWAAE